MAEYPLALVTGGAHRLGRAFALTLAGQGFGILLHYHQSYEKAQETAETIRSCGVPVFLVGADLTRNEKIDYLFDSIDSALTSPENGLTHLAVLINSAATMERNDAKDLPASGWDATMDLNLRAPFLCAQQASRRMDRGGLIVNVSDVAAGKAWSGFPAYTVSKSALESMTRVLARSFAPDIRVNAIAPGLVLPSDGHPVDEWDKLVARLPLQRPATIEEISTTLVFLLRNEYITGQTIVVDGGYSLL